MFGLLKKYSVIEHSLLGDAINDTRPENPILPVREQIQKIAGN
jgi:hypothetical protein